MDSNSLKKIIENTITALEGYSFQDFCDRLGLVLYPNDYTPVRAAGRRGDDKNDGYCPKARVFFQAHATRGEKIKDTKNKIKTDLAGCVAKHGDIKKWIYLTNIPLIGEVETLIDELRPSYPNITIETWERKRITREISKQNPKAIEGILDMNLTLSQSSIVSKKQIGNVNDLKKFEFLLENASWSKEFIDDKEYWVCNEDVMFQIEMCDDYRDFTEKWTQVYPDKFGSGRRSVNLKIYGVTIKQIAFIFCDGGRISVPMPRVKTVNEGIMYYWEKKSLDYKLTKVIGNFYIYEDLEGVAGMSKVEIV
ncbi:hypothetical protein A2769_02720 [Candidatus Daviesbacteria bacterium RIFCSPHIGHO2_01_FULL_37_27]|nr:MAG: hypothetical protein A2769_02720 [Candidatus Daviesbacteria bacterium RIFCSPHIGHO2_01_FULL_37_27]